MSLQLADLDVAALTDDAREALAFAHRIAAGETLEEVADSAGITIEEVRVRIDRLAAEWREQSGIAALPKHTDDEIEAVRTSMQQHGQIVPIMAMEDGRVVDGLLRLRLCNELNLEPLIDYLPAGTTLEQAKSLALVVNLARRHLTTSAKRGVVRDQLLRDASRSDRTIAAAVGCSPTTVGAIRRDLEQAGEVSNLDTRTGKDGKAQPARKPEREPKSALELPDGLVDVTLRLTRDYAAQLDGGTWLECRAVRLVLVGPGTYTLEVRE